jgi:hypothetical protein
MSTVADTITLPAEWRPERNLVPVKAIDWLHERLRVADLDVAELAASIARQGLQQLIAVKVNGPRWLLIAGRRRLEAFRTTRPSDHRSSPKSTPKVCPASGRASSR